MLSTIVLIKNLHHSKILSRIRLYNEYIFQIFYFPFCISAIFLQQGFIVVISALAETSAWRREAFPEM